MENAYGCKTNPRDTPRQRRRRSSCGAGEVEQRDELATWGRRRRMRRRQIWCLPCTMPPQPPQPAVDDDVLGAPLPPAMKVFITDAVADPLAAGHGGCRCNHTPFRLHRAPLPLSLSLTAPATELLAVATFPAAAAAGSGERLATATGRAAVPCDLGEESEVGGGDPDDLGEEE
uniref:Uncharacterized protein n=1 Tax=Oryza glumipatula TaxID=40148 RepID=A0A0E0BR58_9ORYZ